MTLKICDYGCTTAAGPTVKDFWNGLLELRDHSQVKEQSRLCRWKNEQGPTALVRLSTQILTAWEQISMPIRSQQLGVIFASTKGCTQDWISQASFNQRDPLTPVLEKFLELTKLKPKESICVSNACSSTVGALFLANQWIKQKRVKDVLIITADEASSFVTQGFFALRALTQKKAKPFSADRDGLQLGDGAAAIVVSAYDGEGISIDGIGFHTEGFAVARPSHSGESLFNAISQALNQTETDLIVAHGTATVANDEVEDHVFSRVFKRNNIPITSTKWSVGHTLGASAAIDLIAAVQILKTQTVFNIANTENIDPKFKNPYLHGRSAVPKFDINKILLSSLGFGGVHGALLLKREGQ